jgi:hypothetical protein
MEGHMDSFGEKIGLAVIALILGLLAEPIKKIITKERKRLSYSIATKPIFGVDGTLPAALQSQIPKDWSGHLVQFHLRAENSGAQTLSALNVLCVAAADAEIRFYETTTQPPREVPVGTPTNEKSNELRIPDITLERGQSIELDVFVKSHNRPDLQIFWSGGGGGVDWRLTSMEETFGLERNIISAIRYYIYAEISMPLATSIMYVMSASLMSVSNSASWMSIGGVGVGQFFGSILKLYFYIKIVPHALAIAKEFMSRPRVSGESHGGISNIKIIEETTMPSTDTASKPHAALVQS